VRICQLAARHKDVASEHQKSEGCRSWPQQAAPKRVGQVNNTIAVSYEVSMLHQAVASRLPHRTDCLHQPHVEMPWSKSTMKLGRSTRDVAQGLLFGGTRCLERVCSMSCCGVGLCKHVVVWSWNGAGGTTTTPRHHALSPGADSSVSPSHLIHGSGTELLMASCRCLLQGAIHGPLSVGNLEGLGHSLVGDCKQCFDTKR
jgi:hypothetical protein